MHKTMLSIISLVFTMVFSTITFGIGFGYLFPNITSYNNQQILNCATINYTTSVNYTCYPIDCHTPCDYSGDCHHCVTTNCNKNIYGSCCRDFDTLCFNKCGNDTTIYNLLGYSLNNNNYTFEYTFKCEFNDTNCVTIYTSNNITCYYENNQIYINPIKINWVAVGLVCLFSTCCLGCIIWLIYNLFIAYNICTHPMI